MIEDWRQRIADSVPYPARIRACVRPSGIRHPASGIYSYLKSCTVRTNVSTAATGMSGVTPWPRLAM